MLRPTMHGQICAKHSTYSRCHRYVVGEAIIEGNDRNKDLSVVMMMEMRSSDLSVKSTMGVRQMHKESRPFTNFGFKGNFAVMLVDDFFDDIQT
jgi:hypothetical protein